MYVYYSYACTSDILEQLLVSGTGLGSGDPKK